MFYEFAYNQTYVIIDSSLIELLNINFDNIIQIEKGIIIDNKLKVIYQLTNDFQKSQTTWNYTNIQINIDELVQKHNMEIQPAILYQPNTFYNILQPIDIKYSAQKYIQRKTFTKKDFQLPQLGFIKTTGLNGDLDIKNVDEKDQQYIDTLNNFYTNIQNTIIDHISTISKYPKEDIQYPVQFIKQQSGINQETNKSWKSTRMTIKFQQIYQSQQSKNNQETYQQFIDNKLKSFKQNPDIILLQQKDFQPDDKLDVTKLGDFKNKVYECHMVPLDKPQQQVPAPFMTCSTIISIFKDIYNNHIYKCLIQPQIQYGVRSKQLDERTSKNYIKLQITGIIHSILSVKDNAINHDPSEVLEAMTKIIPQTDDTQLIHFDE